MDVHLATLSQRQASLPHVQVRTNPLLFPLPVPTRFRRGYRSRQTLINPNQFNQFNTNQPNPTEFNQSNPNSFNQFNTTSFNQPNPNQFNQSTPNQFNPSALSSPSASLASTLVVFTIGAALPVKLDRHGRPVKNKSSRPTKKFPQRNRMKQ